MDQTPAGTVLLVTMPWAPIGIPSLPLGLLGARLRADGVAAAASHANLRFASLLGVQTYERIVHDIALRFVSEWLFNRGLFPGDDSHPESDRERLELLLDRTRHGFPAAPSGYGAGNARPGEPLDEAFADELLHIRDSLVPRFIEQEALRDEVRQSDLIGFTCTFHQTLPSLALARRIKELYPHKPVVFGGFCFSGEMGPGYMMAFPWIDCCVQGEGEELITPLVRALSRGERRVLSALPGVCWRRDGQLVVNPGRTPSLSLDEHYLPDYSDYFDQARRCRQQGCEIPLEGVAYETSRGCWWGKGERRCRFCGLDRENLPHRVKSAGRIQRDIETLASTHGVLRFHLTDTLLPRAVLRDALAPLRRLDCDFTFICELRATLPKSQIRDLALSGARYVQFGVESFNTELLKLMGKGTTALQNIQALKWCAEHGIQVHYNLLWGVPGERPEQYRKMNALLPLLFHLAPPRYPPSPILFVRNSVYLTDPERYGLRSARPFGEYALLYPGLDPESFAYYFDCETDKGVDPERVRATAELVLTWRERHRSGRPPLLGYRKGPGFVEITDRRAAGTRTIRLDGLIADIFLYCDRIRSSRQIAAHALRLKAPTPSPEKLESNLRWLEDNGLIIEENGRYLGLATRCR